MPTPMPRVGNHYCTEKLHYEKFTRVLSMRGEQTQKKTKNHPTLKGITLNHLILTVSS